MEQKTTTVAQATAPASADGETQVVVITGASAGLGRSIAREFAGRGAKIGLLARGRDGLQAAKKEVVARGGQAIALEVDVTQPAELESAAAKIENTFGDIDIWINNAMVSVFSPFKKMTPEEYKRVTEVTYLGQVYGTMTALKRMLPRDRGKIILVGSALAYRGIPLQSAYCGAKHAIHGFFESLRAELLHDESKVQLSTVQMPAMNTTQFGFVKSRLPRQPKPMGTIFEPEVGARAVAYAAEKMPREVYVGFPTWQTIFGNKVAPGFLDHYMADHGYEGQQTDKPEDPDRTNNLWEPIPGDHGAHGGFDAQSWDFSPNMWATTHKWLTFAVAGGLLLGAGALLSKAFGKKDD